MSRARPRLEISFFLMKFCSCRDRDSSRLGNSVVVETKTHRDWEILWLSRPRLIKTGKFCGCRDRDQPRMNKSCRDRDFIESLADLCAFAPLYLSNLCTNIPCIQYAAVPSPGRYMNLTT